MTADVLPALSARVRTAAHPAADVCACGADATSVLADRPNGTVVRHGATVVKAHAADTARADLAARLAVAAHPGLDGVLLPPLTPDAAELDGRPVTCWPYGTPVDRDDPDAAPWEAAATLLAGLHRTPDAVLPPGLPPMRGPEKAARALARLRAAGPHPAAAPVLRAWAVLPPWARDEAPMPDTGTLCHGDLHLGQLVRAGNGDWLLIDIDDLGRGDPAWDLARPAAWFACGLLPPDEWTRFLAAYRKAGGPAVTADGDPWPALDVPARALTAQTAALAIAKSVERGRPLDEVEMSVVDACDRMAAIPPELAKGRPA
ncbi:aminoglycoside phosphotransferase family protein [Streptomyces beigongshangae]|uniref:aminoglycoside phosphotransferase family protein n=1 Tax=Streptomyces beigongshangae TaxID=2841597 RepID=UPI0027DF6813|nr:aminoglycoside phosphotransferase family protein [Streptomyces sp. REN17]